MKRTLLITLCAALAVSGCARLRDSKVNPTNWFDITYREKRFELPKESVDQRVLAPQVLDMVLEDYTGGLIVRAKARLPSQGWWDGELVPRPIDEDGVLVFDFRIFPPVTETPVGPDQSREITVAASISSIKAATIRKVVVQAEGNSLSRAP